MWRTAGRRLVRHVCLRNPFPLFLLAVCSMQSLPEAWHSWERKYQLCLIAASCPSRRCSCRKRRVSRREAEGLVTELWFPRFVTMQWLCSQLCYVTAANQWTIVEIELLATVGWKCGCPPFSCRCTQNVTNCRKETCSTCLFKESIPVIPFGSLQHAVPTRSLTFLRAEVPALPYSGIMPIPSLQLQKKTCLTQRSRGFGHRVVVSKICYSVSIQLLCSQLCYVTAANQWTIVEIELLATVGWKCGCPPFSCRCTQNVTNCRKETCSTCLFKESIPVIPFGSLQHAVPTRSLTFLRAEVPALPYSGIMPIPPPRCSDCALSCAMWLLQTHEQLSTLSF